ncbi:MAG TPA: carboxylesterase family protein [Caldimonas sp.]|jgi:para-nitrobenzyl esterase
MVSNRMTCILTATVLIACAPIAASAAPTSPVVATDDGPVRGTTIGKIQAFLGIPYAAAPTGDLRWRPPQAHPGWQAVLDASKFGPHCPQVASPYGIASTTEDCLFLNVFTPGKTNSGQPHLLPVMFWIHGGGLVVGESDGYDPTPLVAKGVIVVSINYRLAELGFLAHPALSAESPQGASGNYGLMDQQAAMRWVQRNIRHFGGDANNVTIFGESAGGLSVHAQLASPLPAGLFHKAIVESGAYALSQPSLTMAQASGTAFAAAAGCSSQTAACLRSLSVAAILGAQTAATMVPNLDGFVLPQSVAFAFSSGQFNRVPVIEGSNHDEWRLFVAQTEATTGVALTAAAYIPAIAATLGVPLATATAIATFGYPLASYPSPSVALGAVGTDAAFSCNARIAARLLSTYVPTFQYEFNDPAAPMLYFPPVSFPTGAYHASELTYLFDLSQTPVPNPGLTPAQQDLSAAMAGYWTQFARSGNPNSVGAPDWPSYGVSDLFQSLRPSTPTTAAGFSSDHKCAFWGLS